MRYLAATVTLLFIAIVFAPAVHAQSEEASEAAKKPSFDIAKDVPVEMRFGSYNMIVDLGSLPVGAVGVAKLKLLNNSQVNFPIDEIQFSCTSAKISVDNLDPNGSALLTVNLSTLPRSKNAIVANSITLVSKTDKSKTINVALRYTLSGLMCFSGNNYVQEVDTNLDRQTVMLPFLITDPVSASDVSFEVDPPSFGVVVSLVEEEGERFAKVVFDPVFVSEDSLALSIIARDNSRGLSDTTPLLLCRRKYLEITPRTLRLEADGDEFVTACVLRHRPPLADSSSTSAVKGSPDGAVSVEASIENVKLKVVTKELGRGIYRLYLSGPKNKILDVAKKDSKVSWHIITPAAAYSVDSRLSIDAFDPTAFNDEKEKP